MKSSMQRALIPALATSLLLSVAGSALAAGGDIGNTAKQSTNWTAIIMFTVFVLATLWITKWAAGRTKSAADFYTAGGGITGFQNGLAIAGEIAQRHGITLTCASKLHEGTCFTFRK